MSKDKNIIRWTDKEWRRVADECLRLYGYGDWNISIVAAVRSAQKSVIAEHRQRSTMKGTDNIKPILPILAELKSGPPVMPPPLSKAEQVINEALDQAEGAQAKNTVWENFKEVVPPAPTYREERSVTDVLSTFIADVLVESVKKLLTNGEIARMLRSLQNGSMPSVAVDSTPATKHNPVPRSYVTRERKLECLVCGLKGHQQSEVNNRTVGLSNLHLRYWYADNPNDGITVLKHKAEASDVILFSMEATSHSAVAAVQALGKRIIRVTGGMTTMLDTLLKLDKEQQP
jgi:hypothetical protein